ncbi:MAG: hypothetical protein U5L06_02015 [Rhodovibrio sp.]|nr:hypothetical protein [Rhodovibrio sp.]
MPARFALSANSSSFAWARFSSRSFCSFSSVDGMSAQPGSLYSPMQ